MVSTLDICSGSGLASFASQKRREVNWGGGDGRIEREKTWQVSGMARLCEFSVVEVTVGERPSLEPAIFHVPLKRAACWARKPSISRLGSAGWAPWK